MPNSVLTRQQSINLFLLGAFLSLFSANPVLTTYAFAVLAILLKLNWNAFQPAVFTYGLLYQWLQSSMRVFQANLAGLPLNEFDRNNNAETAVYLSVTGVLLISLILTRWIRRHPFSDSHLIEAFRKISIRKAFQVHLIFIAITPFIKVLKIGGLAQFILLFENFHWFAFCLLALAVLHQQKGYGWLIISFLIEFLIGFSGFFSGFKTVIIYLLIVALSVINMLKVRHLTFFALTSSLLIPLGLFWTAIKGEYRMFLSGGERSQAIIVSKEDQINYLLNAAGNTEKIDWSVAVNGMLDRLQYTRMFQLTLNHVPEYAGHEQGALWQSAVSHVLMPRILFPNKAALDDSQNTSKYTGIIWAGAAEGSSISLGYIAESYVDFGIPWMFVPIIILALFFGYLYSMVVKKSVDSELVALNYVGTIIIFFPFSLIETSPSKLLGGIIMSFLVYHYFIRLVLYPSLWKFVTK